MEILHELTIHRGTRETAVKIHHFVGVCFSNSEIRTKLLARGKKYCDSVENFTKDTKGTKVESAKLRSIGNTVFEYVKDDFESVCMFGGKTGIKRKRVVEVIV